MKALLLIFTLLLGLSVWAESGSEVAPPPMPDYMKKNKEFNVPPPPPPRRKIQSEEPDAVDGQLRDEVRQEFLQAGEEDLEVAETPDIRPVDESPINSDNPEETLEGEEERMVVEETPQKQEIQEVSEVEESAPEFEQATMGEEKIEDAKEEYVQAGDDPNKLIVPTADTQPTSEEPDQTEVAKEMSEEEAPLEAVEEQLEEAEQVAEAALNSPRQPTSDQPFKAGMYKFAKKCQMYAEPSSMSDKAGSIRAGRKLWIDKHDDDWHKAYKKSGAVYISADCLQ